MNKLFYAVILSLFVTLVACEPEEPETNDGNFIVNPNLPPGSGCYPQQILAWNLNPLYTYHYFAENPNVLEMYKQYDEISGNVTHTYKCLYDPLSPTHELDSVYHYWGDYEEEEIFVDVTKFHYSFNNGAARMDSATVHTPDPDGLSWALLKGTIHYVYLNDELSEEYYVDSPFSETGNLYDEYTIEYTYDDDGQMTRQDWYNYNDVLNYYEEYTLSPYIQPNYFVVHNKALAASLLYAPQQTIAWYIGTSQYTYNYIYQVNDENYIVTKDVILQNGDTTASQLLTYECY